MKGGAVKIAGNIINHLLTIKAVKTVVKQSIIDGDLGLSFTYTEKNGDKFMKISSKANGDKFTVTVKEGDKVETKT